MEIAEPASAVARAAVLAAPNRIELSEIPLPEPGARQVRVRNQGCGVCGSNMEPWNGQPWFDYPFETGAPGHEAWGVVEAVGRDVHELSVGDRVATLGQHSFADREVLDAARVVPLPESVSGPFPGEPLACAMNVFERARIEPDQHVAIVGVGFLGALLTQLAVAEGARVMAISRRPFALDVARDAGADVTLRSDDPDAVVERTEAWTDGDLCDVVIEATGKQAPLDLAARLTRVRGRLVVAGYHQDGPRQVDMQLWNWRGLDVINAHERDPERYVDGLHRAIRATAEGRLDPSPLLTHEFPLSELASALDHTRDRPDGFLKAWVRP